MALVHPFLKCITRDIKLNTVWHKDASYITPTQLAEFIVKVVGRGSVEEILNYSVEENKSDYEASLQNILVEILQVSRLVKPIHDHMHEMVEVNRVRFNTIMDLFDEIYTAKYSSPRDALLDLRDTIIHFYMALKNISTNDQEVEELFRADKCSWAIYKLMIETGVFENYIGESDKLPYEGICINICRIIEPTIPYKVKVLEDKFAVLDLAKFINTKASFGNIYHTIPFTTQVYRSAAQCTVALEHGERVERRHDSKFALRMLPNKYGEPHYPSDVLCTFCFSVCDIYSPKCGHFVTCSECVGLLYDDAKCKSCGTCFNETKLFFKLTIFTGESGSDMFKHQCVCSSMLLDKSEELHNVVHNAVIAKVKNCNNDVNLYAEPISEYMNMLSGISTYTLRKRAEKYDRERRFPRYINDTLYPITENVVQKEQHSHDNANSDDGENFFELFVEAMMTNFKRNVISLLLPNSERPMSAEEIERQATLKCELLSMLRPPVHLKRAIESTPLNYAINNPEHTVEQILESKFVPKIYKTSTECVVCLDEGKLVIMASCGHQACCLQCALNLYSRCPVCRCENNELLQS